MEFLLPERIVAAARAIAAGEMEAAEPRNAATVVLLRQGDSPEVYLMRRQSSMAFAAGASVFPGGGVDRRDFEDVAWIGPAAAEWAVRLGTDESTAHALVVAAVRETFEEAGVLFAGSPTALADPHDEGWEADRAALVAGEVSLASVLGRRDLAVRSDLLRAWAGWLTPDFERKRYRTWFFVAALPEGQSARDVSTESSDVAWVPASDVVRQVFAGERRMLPPTALTCIELATHPTVADVLAVDRDVEMFQPRLLERPDGFVLSKPPWADALLEGLG